MFKARQRRTVQYFRRYMLSDEDIEGQNGRQEDMNNATEPLQYPITQIWGDLEPETDKWDRRLLFEVTGIRLDDSEYRGDDTSDEEDEDKKGWRNLFRNKSKVAQIANSEKNDQLMDTLIGDDAENEESEE